MFAFKVWSDAARAASAEARRGKTATHGRMKERANKVTAATKERYTKMKELGDKGIRYRLANRKIGVAEGKSRAWAKIALSHPKGSKEYNRAVHISDSYKASAEKLSAARENY